MLNIHYMACFLFVGLLLCFQSAKYGPDYCTVSWCSYTLLVTRLFVCYICYRAYLTRYFVSPLGLKIVCHIVNCHAFVQWLYEIINYDVLLWEHLGKASERLVLSLHYELHIGLNSIPTSKLYIKYSRTDRQYNKYFVDACKPPRRLWLIESWLWIWVSDL